MYVPPAFAVEDDQALAFAQGWFEDGERLLSVVGALTDRTIAKAMLA